MSSNKHEPTKSKPNRTTATSKSADRTATLTTQKSLTKKARLIALLGSKRGATIAEISSELAWLHHTTRSALTGLRKAGFDVSSSKPDSGGAGRYHVSSVPKTANADSAVKTSRMAKKTAASK